jgi:hypothetical protein
LSDEQAPATATTEGSPEAVGSVAAPSQTPDPSDFESRIRSDPEFAIAEFKKQQAAASRANDRIRKGSLALDIAERLGGGDLAKGAEAALSELTLYRQMQAHPEMKALIERWQSGQPLSGIATEAGSSSYGSGLDDDDPRDQQLRTLQGTTARLQEKIAQREMVDHFKAFADGDIGKHLLPDERKEVFDAIGAQLRAWSQTPAGREQAASLDLRTIELVAIDHLRNSGKLLELGARAARQRAEGLQQRETDVPSRIVSAAAPTQKSGENVTAIDAWKEAKRALGIA